MNYYCSHFDANYLTRALALYESLRASGEEFNFFAVCFDDFSVQVLERLDLPGLTVVSLAEFETKELLQVKLGRTACEYFWTCTPFVVSHVIHSNELPSVTYLDADLFFFRSPQLLFDEFDLAEASVLITSHRYTPCYDRSETAGKYCVQFLTIKADPQGLATLQWWKERCLEWCYNRFEDGKFGDQKYLDHWPEMFSGVHVLKHMGGGVAPWNVQQYHLTVEGTTVLVDKTPLVFYHFHQFKQYDDGSYNLCFHYRIDQDVVDLIYRPYVKALLRAEEIVGRTSPDYRPAYEGRKWSDQLKFLAGRIKGTYNVYATL